MAHKTLHLCLIPKSKHCPISSIYCSFFRKLQKTRAYACFPFPYESKLNSTHLKYHQGFPVILANQRSAQEESCKQTKSYFPGAFLPSPLSSSPTNNIFDSFHSAHSQLCAPPSSPFYAFPFSHLCLHFHSVLRPLSQRDSTFNQDRHCSAS